jgi:hypothetical protein
MSLLTTDKNTEIFCVTDDFCKEFSKEMAKISRFTQQTWLAVSLPETGRKMYQPLYL